MFNFNLLQGLLLARPTVKEKPLALVAGWRYVIESEHRDLLFGLKTTSRRMLSSPSREDKSWISLDYAKNSINEVFV